MTIWRSAARQRVAPTTPTPPAAPLVGPDAIAVTWAGHATASIRLDGVHLLTDPALRQRISVLRRHAVPVPRHVTDAVDAVLISHMHHDHLDLPSLRLLGLDTPIITPRGVAALLHAQGFTDVRELSVGQCATVGPVRIEAWPAAHPGGRGPFGPVAEALGYLIHGSATAYFAGDTDLFGAMHDLRGQVDVALLPVGGWGPTLGEGHLDAERAAEALRRIAPAEALPIHWGTFWPLGLPRGRPAMYADAAAGFCTLAEQHVPRTRVHLLRPGEHIVPGRAT